MKESQTQRNLVRFTLTVFKRFSNTVLEGSLSFWLFSQTSTALVWYGRGVIRHTGSYKRVIGKRLFFPQNKDSAKKEARHFTWFEIHKSSFVYVHWKSRWRPWHYSILYTHSMYCTFFTYLGWYT